MENSSTQIEFQDQRSRANSGSHHWIVFDVFNVSNVFNAWRSVSLPGKTTGCRSEGRGEGLGPTLGTPNIQTRVKEEQAEGVGRVPGEYPVQSLEKGSPSRKGCYLLLRSQDEQCPQDRAT